MVTEDEEDSHRLIYPFLATRRMAPENSHFSNPSVTILKVKEPSTKIMISIQTAISKAVMRLCQTFMSPQPLRTNRINSQHKTSSLRTNPAIIAIAVALLIGVAISSGTADDRQREVCGRTSR